MSSASEVTIARHDNATSAEAFSTAFSTERRLPIPMSTIATSAIRSLERPLRRRHAGDASVDPRRLRERFRESLERDLDDVMQVFAFEQAHVQVARRRARERLEENRSELDVPGAELGFGKGHLPDEE